MKEQRAQMKEQRAQMKEQRAQIKEQRAQIKEQRAQIVELTSSLKELQNEQTNIESRLDESKKRRLMETEQAMLNRLVRHQIASGIVELLREESSYQPNFRVANSSDCWNCQELKLGLENSITKLWHQLKAAEIERAKLARESERQRIAFAPRRSVRQYKIGPGKC